jgi:hypothetical protein
MLGWPAAVWVRMAMDAAAGAPALIQVPANALKTSCKWDRNPAADAAPDQAPAQSSGLAASQARTQPPSTHTPFLWPA